MAKRIAFSNMTLCSDGSMQIKFVKQIIDPDTGEVIHEEPHRTVVDFDGDVDLQLEAVSRHLKQMKYPGVSAKVRALIKAADAVIRSDDDVQERRAQKIAMKAALMQSAV